MSSFLFRLYYSKDVDGIKALLESWSSATPMAYGSLPSPASKPLSKTAAQAIRQDINRRDHFGRTVLHLAATSGDTEIVKALVKHPSTDIHLADLESGWTALHRSLYYGHIACAMIILGRSRDAIRAKDSEGNSPFDVYNSTIEGTNPPALDVTYGGTDLFTWGSNANNSLGFADMDNRAYPERISLVRSEAQCSMAVDRLRELRVRDVQMSKYHTALLTTESIDNLLVCGIGNSGRLGLGVVGTQLSFRHVKGLGGGMVGKIAIAQDHTLAVMEDGSVYTWGSNKYGQLGYVLEVKSKDDPVQWTPRKVVTMLKREVVIGCAVSNIHSVVFTDNELYVWGLNEGQLGLTGVESETKQTTPRKVTILPSRTVCIAATDKATGCLLANNEVFLLANGGFCKIVFPLQSFGDITTYRPKQMYAANLIQKLVAGDSTTFAAVSSMGDVFSFSLDTTQSGMKPFALSKSIKPLKIWSLRRKHMAVRDVAVGQKGSVIICTQSGAVYVRVPRVKVKTNAAETKEYKFSRISYLTRTVAVRANAFGSFSAIRSDAELREIVVGEADAWYEMRELLPYASLFTEEKGVISETSSNSGDEGPSLKKDAFHEQVLQWTQSEEFDLTLSQVCQDARGTDLILSSYQGEIPVHRLVITKRSRTLARLMKGGKVNGLTYQPGKILFGDLSLLALINLVHVLYTDSLLPFWLQYTRSNLPKKLAQARDELLQLVRLLDLGLEDSIQFDRKVPKRLASEMSVLLNDESFPTDMIIELADKRVACHSLIMRTRCEFFEAMYLGAAGSWVASRYGTSADSVININLKHIKSEYFMPVLCHIYSDAGEECLFTLQHDTTSDFIEYVIQVMAVANELLLTRFMRICESFLAGYVNMRNVAQVLSDSDIFAAEDLKMRCLEYLCLNGEGVVENYILEEVDDSLISDLEARVVQMQLLRFPITRSEIQLQSLLERHPGLESLLKREKDVRRLGPASSPLLESSPASAGMERQPSDHGIRVRKGRHNSSNNTSPLVRPILPSGDLMFEMDEEFSLDRERKAKNQIMNQEWQDVRRRSPRTPTTQTLGSPPDRRKVEKPASRQSSAAKPLSSPPPRSILPEIIPITPKLSQRERRRQQQQHTQPPAPSPQIPKSQSAPNRSPQPAWQTPRAAKVSLVEVVQESKASPQGLSRLLQGDEKWSVGPTVKKDQRTVEEIREEEAFAKWWHEESLRIQQH